jgi:tRNA(Ile)-lysidine synthetase-like protein
MLGVSRAEVTDWAQAHGLAWREDETNREPRYLRNRIRKELLPLIERRYRPRIRRRLATLARRVSDGIGPADDRGRTPMRPVPRVAGPAAGAQNLPAIAFERRVWTPGGEIPDGRRVAVFDAADLGPVEVRRLADGDRIRPFGHIGRRKVRDLLREAGIPAAERPETWVVAAGGEIVWVPGLLRSDAAPILETTKDVWVFWTGGTGGVTLTRNPSTNDWDD